MYKFCLFFNKGVEFFNIDVHDLLNVHFKNSGRFTYYNDVDIDFAKKFIDNNLDNKICVILYLHGALSLQFQIDILDYIKIKNIADKTLKILFFTFDFWIRPPDIHCRYLEKVFRADDHYVVTFAQNIQQLNSFLGKDYSRKNIIFENIWCCYNSSFIEFNENPINKIYIPGRISTNYPERLLFENSKHVVTIDYSMEETKKGSHKSFNQRLNSYLCCMTSSVYVHNETSKQLENTHLILLKVFEILAAGSLLLVPSSEKEYLDKIGIHSYENCIMYDNESREEIVEFVTNLANRAKVDEIRKTGQIYAKNNLNSELKFKEIMWIFDYELHFK